MSILFYLATITLAILMLSIIEAIIGGKSIKYLRDIKPLRAREQPVVSVIIPACNEERNIEAALQSVLSQDYRNIEIIIVNDRSTDRTKAILDRLAKTNHRLKVLHISELPEGWLGKTHALYCGAQAATGDLLLLADADVLMEASVVSRAANFMIEERIDNLVIAPEITMRGALLNMTLLAFAANFMLNQRPWKARDPRSRKSAGGGAFSMIRREAYESSGTIKAVALCVDDDLKLGKLIKSHGFRQDYLAGQGMVRVEWYDSIRGMINGLTKNSFAALNYNIAKTVFGLAGLLIFNVWPVFALFLTGGNTLVLNAVIILLMLGVYAKTARLIPTSPLYAFGYPIANCILCYIILRSTLTTLINGGVRWRGTYYSLKELKRNNLRV